MAQPIPSNEFDLRLFPLPNLVFFPEMRLPLHVFEPRYRALVGDALSSDERIGMILLRSGWEADYYGAPPVHHVGTLGVIEQVVKFEDGRYNLLLNGQTRFRIVRETEGLPYRVARVVAVPQREIAPMDAWAQREWLVDLSRRYLELLPGQMAVPELDSANLESLINALIMSLNVEPLQKQEMLEMDDVLARGEKVGSVLEERVRLADMLAPYRRDSDPGMN